MTAIKLYIEYWVNVLNLKWSWVFLSSRSVSRNGKTFKYPFLKYLQKTNFSIQIKHVNNSESLATRETAIQYMTAPYFLQFKIKLLLLAEEIHSIMRCAILWSKLGHLAQIENFSTKKYNFQLDPFHCAKFLKNHLNGSRIKMTHNF